MIFTFTINSTTTTSLLETLRQQYPAFVGNTCKYLSVQNISDSETSKIAIGQDRNVSATGCGRLLTFIDHFFILEDWDNGNVPLDWWLGQIDGYVSVAITVIQS